MLNVNGLSVRYGGAEVIGGIDFALAPGTVTALIGPNGTGKSSLLKAVAGLIPSGGTMAMPGCPKPSRSEIAASVAYMPQDTGPASSLTVLEVVLLGRLRSLGLRVPASLRDEAEAALALFALASLQTRTLDALSGGQRQLVYLAQALFRDPPILLLDEPTASLDLNHQLSVLEAICRHTRARGKITVIALHDLTLAARFADRILCLSGGRLTGSGQPEAVLTPHRLRDMYRVEAEIGRSADGLLTVTPLRSA